MVHKVSSAIERIINIPTPVSLIQRGEPSNLLSLRGEVMRLGTEYARGILQNSPGGIHLTIIILIWSLTLDIGKMNED